VVGYARASLEKVVRAFLEQVRAFPGPSLCSVVGAFFFVLLIYARMKFLLRHGYCLKTFLMHVLRNVRAELLQSSFCLFPSLKKSRRVVDTSVCSRVGHTRSFLCPDLREGDTWVRLVFFSSGRWCPSLQASRWCLPVYMPSC